MEKTFENMTKAELIKRLEKEIKFTEECLDRIEQYKDMEDRYRLLKHLYNDYVITKERNIELETKNDIMSAKIQDLLDLCDRQQKLIDSKYD